MFGRRNFGLASIFLMLTGVILFGTTLFIPQLLQTVMGYTATDAGLALTAGGAATIIAMPLVGILSSRVDPRLLIGGAFLVQGFALMYMGHLDTDLTFADAARARMFQAVGIPFLFVPISLIAYVGLRPEESNQASAMMNVARNLGGTIGISSVQTILAQRQQFHQARLVEGLNPLNPNYVGGLSRLTQGLVGQGQSMVDAPQQALGTLYATAQRQAAMLSYLDVFHVLMIVIFASIPLLFFMRGPQARGAQGHEAVA
jgi:DHA2 family multidrug resistance protein